MESCFELSDPTCSTPNGVCEFTTVVMPEHVLEHQLSFPTSRSKSSFPQMISRLSTMKSLPSMPSTTSFGIPINGLAMTMLQLTHRNCPLEMISALEA